MRKILSNKALLLIAVFVLALLLTVACSSKKTATAIPHSTEGREDCLSCHQTGVNGATKMPHEPRKNCTECHKPKEG